MRLTERDLELLRWINGHGFVTARQVAEWMGASRQAAHRRLGLLHREGYLLRERLFHGEDRAYHVSALGQEASGDGLSRLEMISPATYRHNRMLVDLAQTVISKTGGHFTPERRLRQERAKDGLSRDSHVPDGLLQIKGKKPIAIELELTAKSRRRLEAIVDDYLRSDLGEVWYFTGDEQIRRKLKSVTDGYRMFKIRPLETPS